MSDTYKIIVRRSFEEIWNKRNLAIVDELYAPHYIGHIAASAEPIRGPEALKSFAAMFQFAFPDIHFVIEDQVAEGSKVASRWTVYGNQQRMLKGILPRGTVISLSGISIQQLDEGKIIESWDNWDALPLLQGMTGDVFAALSVGF